jgi:hypothetical protein
LEIIMRNRNAVSTFVMAALLAATNGSALAAGDENYPTKQMAQRGD